LKRLFTLLAVLVAFSLYGQKGTHSPYSIFGVGELNNQQYAAIAAMGGVSVANTDSTIVNYANPASYAYVHRYRPIFQLGLNGRFSQFITESGTTNQRHFGLNQFQLGLPIKKRWGAAFGIKPYSFSGYTVTNLVIDSDGDTTQQFVNEGSGGISMVYLGVSALPIKTSKTKPKYFKTLYTENGEQKERLDSMSVTRKHQLSLGFNANYLFGSAIRKRSFEYVSPILGWNSRVENSLRVSDVTLDLGLNYQYSFISDSSGGSIAFGATYTPSRKLRAFQDLIAYSYGGSFYDGIAPAIVDTIQFIEDNEGNILIPEAYKVGLEYRIGPNRINTSVLRIGADFQFQSWSKYDEQFDGSSYTNQLKDRMSIGLGLEWTPETVVMNRGNSTSFLGRLHYRLGFNYTQTELRILNNLDEYQNLDDYGMSFGLGIPVGVANRSNTNINFGAKFGKLGTAENGLIQEKYIGVFFGLSITPGVGSYWFVKRKYK